MKIEIQCPDCDCTGLCRGLLDPTDFAVVCTSCGGSGKKTIEFVQFVERKIRNDVRTVCWSRDMMTKTVKERAGIPPMMIPSMGKSSGIPYADFLDGKWPPRST